MNVVQSTKPNQSRMMWLAVALALITALAYVLIALGILGVGDLQVAKDGGAIVYVAAGCYLLGGLLILLRKRWLWILGILINSLVVLFFFNLYKDRPAVLFSPGGLISKIPQLLLELTLIYLIIADWSRSRRLSA
jgi:hypothetical protein